jgi:hypothetical protein
MATSPLFGWEEPDDTDLVKDGAAAIRTLGNAIDTSMGDLLGGTTGQVLSKASNTNMDFTWVTSDDANAIQNTIVDAKGDLISATGSDVPARLAVGANGETLVADSSTSTGLRYTAGTVQANPVLNSAMQVWQRGTSFAITTPFYTADRWLAARLANAAGSTVSRQLTNDTTNLPNIQYCLRFARDSGNTSTNTLYLAQAMETVNSIPFAGKTVTVSYYARAGANYSSASSIVNVKLQSGTGTDQNNLTGAYTGSTNVTNTNTILTTTWQRFSATGTVAATATELAFLIENTPVGTAGAADFYEITGIQIDIGSVALPFRTYAGTIQGELAACQRYYYRVTGAFYSNASFAMGYAYATNGASYLLNLPVTQRSGSPTVAVSAAGDFQVGGTSGGVGVSSVGLGNANTTLVRLDVTPVSSGLTVNQSTELRAVNTNAWIGVSAEL